MNSFVYSAAIYSAATDTPVNKAFVQAFSQETGVELGFYSTGAYVAGLFLEEALRTVGGRIEDKGKAWRECRLEAVDDATANLIRCFSSILGRLHEVVLDRGGRTLERSS